MNVNLPSQCPNCGGEIDWRLVFLTGRAFRKGFCLNGCQPWLVTPGGEVKQATFGRRVEDRGPGPNQWGFEGVTGRPPAEKGGKGV